ncbi:MAG TPA: hypothetical protein V6C76_13220 [Drouetiella sp.]
MNNNSDGEPLYGNSSREHWRLVHDQNTASEILHELCDVLPTFLIERVAEHKKASPETLTRLSLHDDPIVRTAVCENPNTPVDVLEYLVNDDCPDVRYAMAENHNLANNLLITLCDDDNPYVSSRAQKTLLRLQQNKTIHGQFNFGLHDRRQFG